MDRVGKPYGAAAQLVGGVKAELAAAEDQCGRFASLMCSAQLCCDTLGMKVEGTHNVFWLAKCTGWSLVWSHWCPHQRLQCWRCTWLRVAELCRYRWTQSVTEQARDSYSG